MRDSSSHSHSNLPSINKIFKKTCPIRQVTEIISQVPATALQQSQFHLWTLCDEFQIFFKRSPVLTKRSSPAPPYFNVVANSLSNLRNNFRGNAPRPNDQKEQNNIEIGGVRGRGPTEVLNMVLLIYYLLSYHDVAATCEIISVTSPPEPFVSPFQNHLFLSLFLFFFLCLLGSCGLLAVLPRALP